LTLAWENGNEVVTVRLSWESLLTAREKAAWASIYSRFISAKMRSLCERPFQKGMIPSA